MTEYEVHLTETALEAIRAQARYIAVDASSPQNAQRWLEAILDAIDSLAQFPGRAAKAEEDRYVDYEVRQLVVGQHLLLFTVHCGRRPTQRVGAEPSAWASSASTG